eukprot:3980581-Amphidinium_carterae.1
MSGPGSSRKLRELIDCYDGLSFVINYYDSLLYSGFLVSCASIQDNPKTFATHRTYPCIASIRCCLRWRSERLKDESCRFCLRLQVHSSCHWTELSTF